MDKSRILSVLQNIDQDLALLGQQISLIIVGYSAVILSGAAHRGTEDIDVLETRPIRLMMRHGLHCMPEDIVRLYEGLWKEEGNE